MPDEMDQFDGEFVSLFAMVRKRDLHHMKVKKALDAAGVRPALDPEALGATFYRRSENLRSPSSRRTQRQFPMMTYAQFKTGPVRRILAAFDLIFLKALDVTSSYAWFRLTIVMLNESEANRGCFVKAARRYARVGSTGERELLKGMLVLTDFAHVADEISAG